MAERLPLVMEVEIAMTDGVITTLEGEVAYRAGDAIVTGTQGERWPVQRKRFEATYSPCAGTHFGSSGRYQRELLSVLARCLEAPMEIRLSDNRGVLRGQAGDWLVEYDPGDRAIIADAIFRQTYRIVPMN